MMVMSQFSEKERQDMGKKGHDAVLQRFDYGILGQQYMGLF